MPALSAEVCIWDMKPIGLRSVLNQASPSLCQANYRPKGVGVEPLRGEDLSLRTVADSRATQPINDSNVRETGHSTDPEPPAAKAEDKTGKKIARQSARRPYVDIHIRPNCRHPTTFLTASFSA